MYVYRKLPIFIFLINIICSRIIEASLVNPALQNPVISLHKGDDWQNVQSSAGTTIFAPFGDDLFLHCEAPYPIQWNITGLIAPSDIVKFQPPKRNLEAQTFHIKLNIFFLDARQSPALSASANIVCESITNHANREQVSVFVRGNHSFVEPMQNTIMDSTQIPCPTTDPTTQTKLYLLNEDGSERLLSDVKFVPTTGFHSNDFFNGKYECRKDEGEHTVTITALTSSKSGYRVSPSSETIKAFSNNFLEVKCASDSKPVTLVIGKNEKILTEYTVNKRHEKVLRITLADAEGSGLSTTGKVSCVSDDEELVKEWSYEFIDAPELYLDNFEGEVDCISEAAEKAVQTVRCRNSMDCQFMSHCFQNISACNFKKLKHFHSNTNTYCWIEKLHKGKACASVPYYHLNGLAQCTVAGLTKSWDYFVSLDFRRYSSWKDAPRNELLRMDDMPDLLFTNEITTFFCAASAYLFADSLSFQIEFNNGTRRLLKDDGKHVKISNPHSENQRKIDELNVLGILKIQLPRDAVAIHCLAPWWNSTELMVTSRKFETKTSLSPTISNNAPHVKETFYIGETNRRIICPAKGEPQPVYVWLFERENVADKFPELKTSTGKDGEGYLEFPIVDAKYSGEFQCMATNALGSSRMKYAIKISDQCRYNLDCKQ